MTARARKPKGPRIHANIPAAIEILRDAYGLDPRIFNHYQLRIRHEESPNIYDWYHTTGSLVVTRNGFQARLGTARDAETVALRIKEHVYR